MSHDAFLGRALRDPATGLPNLPYLQLIRDWEERRGRRRRYDVRVLEIAVDGGTERVRRALSWHLGWTLRDSDLLASAGPSHFQVLLTSPDAEHIEALSARLEEMVAELNEQHRSDDPLRLRFRLLDEPRGEPDASAE